MKTKASLDTPGKIITIAVLVLFLAIGYQLVSKILAAEDLKSNLIYFGALLLLIVIFSGCYLFSTTSYSLEQDKLLIHRPVGPVEIDIANIAEARPVDSKDFSGTVRTFGVGGLFGYYGRFSNSQFGSMTWYVTQKANRVLLVTKQGRKIVISPDDLTFVKRLEDTLLIEK